MTAPGIPMIFQGQEFLQSGWFRDDRPLDWHLADEHKGIVQLYRDLIALRRNTNGWSKGLTGQGFHIFHVNDEANVIAFQRWFDHGAGDDVVAVVNMGATDRDGYRIGLPCEGVWKVRINSDSSLYGAMGSNAGPAEIVAAADEADGLSASVTLTIPSYSMLVLSQEPAA
jgi:1,4-alpha-glucan branching enzyme